jgi:aspartyl-tRNA(Asn)/glutamyl-tRNA(Gln) amidotransferase subunit B
MDEYTQLLGEYKLVLGLEIHFHLKTKTKMFCRCDANFYGATPNTHTCPVCLGLPGALPVPNNDAIRAIHVFGKALGCRLNEHSRFDRKHYSYPDLPKGYQISQYLQPFCEDGILELSSGETIDIERIHLEEDTAKSVHQNKRTLIDFNKSSVPLVEIVTQPVFRSVDDAVEFSKKIQDLVRLLDIGDADMEKGQMRLEANISLRTAEMEREDELPKYKVEIKNINSFRFMEKAVKAEIIRQREMLEKGEQPVQENRGFDETKNVTVAQRSKENAHDYRYFPEPDIPPFVFEESYFEEIENLLPELPWEIKSRLIDQYGLSEKNAEFLSTGVGIELLEKFEDIAAENVDPEKAANILINKLEYRELSPSEFAEKLLEDENKIDSHDELYFVVEEVIANNMDAVENYKNGNAGSIQFLIGQVMRETKGKADAAVVKDLLEKTIK